MKKIYSLLLAFLMLFGATIAHASTEKEFRRTQATWYGKAWDGRRTASGEIFNSRGFTVAHPTLPLGTVLEVRRGANSVFVRVTDRCRCNMDLTHAAASALGMVQAGRAAVEYSVAKYVPVPAQNNDDDAPSNLVAASKPSAPSGKNTATAAVEGVDLGAVY